MSSTDDGRLAASFFGELLVPAAERLRQRGIVFFPLGPVFEEPSWWEGPPSGPDFVPLDTGSIESRLRDLWRSEGLPELDELVQPLMELAEKLEVRDLEDSEVSPFVYVMY